jgi:hypothetical protein
MPGIMSEGSWIRRGRKHVGVACRVVYEACGGAEVKSLLGAAQHGSKKQGQ